MSNAFNAKWNIDLEAALKALTPIAKEEVLNASARKGARTLAEAFRRKVPVQSGFMRRTVGIRRQKKDEIDNVIYNIGTGAFYIKFLEWGTKHIPARHDLREAFDESGQEASRDMQYECAVRIERAWYKAIRAGQEKARRSAA